jgi:hypothetical protein
MKALAFAVLLLAAATARGACPRGYGGDVCSDGAYGAPPPPAGYGAPPPPPPGAPSLFCPHPSVLTCSCSGSS